VVDIVGDEAFLREVRAKGDRLARGLGGAGLDARGLGLMVAFACPDAPDLARRLLIEQHLVTNATGPNTIRLLPPLTVSEAEIDEAVRRIDAC
jgi:acetylornithine/N-succinyldiaminopimelate aminotransferase